MRVSQQFDTDDRCDARWLYREELSLGQDGRRDDLPNRDVLDGSRTDGPSGI